MIYMNTLNSGQHRLSSVVLFIQSSLCSNLTYTYANTEVDVNETKP